MDQVHDAAATDFVDYQTDPSRYRHWQLIVEGSTATLAMNVDEEGGIRPGYRLKLNSYDLGVDIELHDALQRLRFEYPQVRAVIVTSTKPRIFCSGANIYMLASCSHAWKVNFCKFTNETRIGIEDASRHSGLKFIAACNGTTAGGGYELALACDEIVLVDDRSSAVSLPETPLLGVLPGTGGLTRLIDKRRVRRDRADLFCTSTDGVRGERAVEWRLVDAAVRTQHFDHHVRSRAEALAAQSDRPDETAGVRLTPLKRSIDADGLHYEHVDVQASHETRTATITVIAPAAPQEQTIARALEQGAAWWPLQMARELDDAILSLRTNELELGLWIVRTAGNRDAVLAVDAFIDANRNHWFVREVLGMMRRTFARLEVTSRSIFAFVLPESCFAGSLLELALAADRTYMFDAAEDSPRAEIMLSPLNFGALPTVARQSRLASRLRFDPRAAEELKPRVGVPLGTVEAVEAGLVTMALDELDWDDEVRQAIESRTALSPDALTGMEANLRFGPEETMETRIFGRLSAWQNWIFSRPNAVGAEGALKVYGSGAAARFDRERV